MGTGKEGQRMVALPRPKSRREVAGFGRRLPVLVATGLAVVLLFATCTWVDPQCLSLGRNGSDRPNPGSLSLIMQLQVVGRVWLSLDGRGGWRYIEDDLWVCHDMGQQKFRTLAGFWTGPALRVSEPLCDPGYAYVPPGYDFRSLEGKCADAWDGVVRRADAYLPYVEMMIFSPGAKDSARRESALLMWDLESRLPMALDEAAAGMFGLLCEESRKFSRVLRRRHPELAAWAGCVEDDA